MNHSRFTWIVYGGLLLVAASVFAPTLRQGFLNYDDDKYVCENRPVVAGLTPSGVVWAFTHSHAANWHPLTWLSHMLDCEVYGLRPAGHHATNVLLHALAAVLLCLVLFRLTGELWPSACAAGLFALHPLRVESVAWVAERKDVLSGLFFLLTLVAYAAYARRRFSWYRYLAVVVLAALGLMAKPMLVTLPFVLLLLDYWPLRRFEVGSAVAGSGEACQPQRRSRALLQLVVEKIPLFAMAAAVCIVTLVVQQPGMEYSPWSRRLGNALISYVVYLGQMFCPAGLAPFYPGPTGDLPLGEMLGSLLLLAGISAAAWALRRRHPYFLVGWLWYLGMLVPVIGLVQVGWQARADRYTYLPQIGLVLALVWLVFDLSRSWCYRRWICGAGAAAILAGLTAATLWQISYWRNSETLWTHALRCTSGNYVAHDRLGNALYEQGKVAEAVAEYQKAIVVKPSFPEAFLDLGVALRQQGHLDQAMVAYRRALEARPDYALAHNNLGVILEAQGKFNEAGNQYRMALASDPQSASAHNNLGNILSRSGAYDQAMAQYQTALQIDPSYVLARQNLGIALQMQGKMAEALAQWREVLRAQPDQLAVLNHAAWILATYPDASIRNGGEALGLAQRAARLCGGQDPLVMATLAAACAETGRFAEAAQLARQAAMLASRQGNAPLAERLEKAAGLYRAGLPLRDK